MLLGSAVQCSALQCSAEQSNAGQCSAVQCSAEQSRAEQSRAEQEQEQERPRQKHICHTSHATHKIAHLKSDCSKIRRKSYESYSDEGSYESSNYRSNHHLSGNRLTLRKAPLLPVALAVLCAEAPSPFFERVRNAEKSHTHTNTHTHTTKHPTIMQFLLLSVHYGTLQVNCVDDYIKLA